MYKVIISMPHALTYYAFFTREDAQAFITKERADILAKNPELEGVLSPWIEEVK